jgi:CheY-like chemotaxis protein
VVHPVFEGYHVPKGIARAATDTPKSEAVEGLDTIIVLPPAPTRLTTPRVTPVMSPGEQQQQAQIAQQQQLQVPPRADSADRASDRTSTPSSFGSVMPSSSPQLHQSASITELEALAPAGNEAAPAVPAAEAQLLPPKSKRPRALCPLTILCAEDNPINQKVLHRILEGEGHTVVMTNDGLQAVQRFQQQPFDVVLLDICMPVMDGLAACQHIRDIEQERENKRQRSLPLTNLMAGAQPSASAAAPSAALPASSDFCDRGQSVPLSLPAHPNARLPVFAVTASGLLGDREACRAAGMDEVIVKPIEIKVLRALLKPISMRKARRTLIETTPPVAVWTMQHMAQLGAASTTTANDTDSKSNGELPPRPPPPIRPSPTPMQR